MCINIDLCIYVYMYTYIDTHSYACGCMYVCMYVCIHMHTPIYIALHASVQLLAPSPKYVGCMLDVWALGMSVAGLP